MPRSRWFLALPLCIAHVCAGSFALAQSGVDTVYHLHGSVVDGVTGKPVARALVTSLDRRIAVLTNGQGHFSVDLRVPARASAQQLGQMSNFGVRNGAPTLQLLAQRPNFLPNTEIVSVPLDDSLNSREVTIRLMPGATLSGSVTAAGTDSTRGVQVSLLHRRVIDGAYVWTQAGRRSVNAEGTFRFTHLEPGEYTVMSSEWTGGPASSVDFSRVSAQYPPDFLGDTASFEGATQLRARYGEDLTAALHLHTASYFPVVVPVQNQTPNGPINVRIIGANTFNGFTLGWNGRESAVTGALPSGSYTLLISSFGPHPAAVTVPLTVAGQPLQHAPVALAAGSDIPVRVHLEFSESDSTGTNRTGNPAGVAGRIDQGHIQNPFNLSLRPVDPASGVGGSGMRTRDDGTIVIENAQPGHYVVQANAFRGYIAALTSGSIDLLRAPLVVSDGGSADPIEVTIRDDGATLNGTVDDAGDPPANPTSLVLLPMDGSSQMRVGSAFGSASFTIPNIAPGTYRLLALRAGRQPQQFPYRDPEAMKRYNGKGVLVTLTPGQSAAVHVALTNLDDIPN